MYMKPAVRFMRGDPIIQRVDICKCLFNKCSRPALWQLFSSWAFLSRGDLCFNHILAIFVGGLESRPRLVSIDVRGLCIEIVASHECCLIFEGKKKKTVSLPDNHKNCDSIIRSTCPKQKLWLGYMYLAVCASVTAIRLSTHRDITAVTRQDDPECSLCLMKFLFPAGKN